MPSTTIGQKEGRVDGGSAPPFRGTTTKRGTGEKLKTCSHAALSAASSSLAWPIPNFQALPGGWRGGAWTGTPGASLKVPVGRMRMQGRLLVPSRWERGCGPAQGSGSRWDQTGSCSWKRRARHCCYSTQRTGWLIVQPRLPQPAPSSLPARSVGGV